MGEGETGLDRFANATPRPWASDGEGIIFAVRTQTNHNTLEQPAVAVCRPDLQVGAAFVDGRRYDVDTEAVYRANEELIVAAVNSYSPSDAEQLIELRKLARQSLTWFEWWVERGQAREPPQQSVELLRKLRAALNPSHSQAKETR